MTRKRFVVSIDPQHAARQLLLTAAPLIGAYGVEEMGVELNFSDPEGKQRPSPRGTTYTSAMHAYFHFTCPMRQCTGGGFEANADLLSALSRHQDGYSGTVACQGVRPRNGVNAVCNIKLRYTLDLRGKPAKVAA